MSAELVASFPNVEIALFAEGKGIFDVALDGKTIYSKYETHRFPDTGELSALIKQ